MKSLVTNIVYLLLVLATLTISIIAASNQPENLGCDTAKDLLNWQQCRTLEHHIWFVNFRGCGKGDGHSYSIENTETGTKALVCCGPWLKACTIRSGQ